MAPGANHGLIEADNVLHEADDGDYIELADLDEDLDDDDIEIVYGPGGAGDAYDPGAAGDAYDPAADFPILEASDPVLFNLEAPTVVLLFNKYMDRVNKRIETVSRDMDELRSAMVGMGDHSLNVLMSKQEAFSCVRYHLNLFQERKYQYHRMVVEEVRAARDFKNCLERLKSGWDSQRLDRAVMNHLLRMRYLQTAQEFAERRNIRDLFPIEPFREAQRIAEALRSKNFNPAKEWCRENAPGSKLAYHLEFQEYIEHVRADRKMDAISFARKFVKEQFWNDYKKEVLQMFGAVVFGCNTEVPRYKKLFDAERLEFLVKLFNEEFNCFTQDASSLCTLLEAGIIAVKASLFYIPKDRTKYLKTENPVEQKYFDTFALPLLCSRLMKPRLRCCVTNKLMNEKNPPFMLPNGCAYSQEGILLMQNGEDVTCSRTGCVYKMSDVKQLKLEGRFGYSLRLKKEQFFSRRFTNGALAKH